MDFEVYLGQGSLFKTMFPLKTNEIPVYIKDTHTKMLWKHHSVDTLNKVLHVPNHSGTIAQENKR